MTSVRIIKNEKYELSFYANDGRPPITLKCGKYEGKVRYSLILSIDNEFLKSQGKIPSTLSFLFWEYENLFKKSGLLKNEIGYKSNTNVDIKLYKWNETVKKLINNQK
tara:strand:+ start:1911 stop:2234 length:324 start_codon:yes stop_codon:yes gene_type:complete